MNKTIIRRTVPELLTGLKHYPALLQRVYAAREITSSDDVSRELRDLLPFDTLSGLPEAIARLSKALEQQEHILIVGDFDADGATSSALAESALRAFGAKNVGHLVPNRFTYGYGLTPEIVEVAAKRNPDLIITVDNGVSSCEGVSCANALGIDVVVTDHHLPGEELPNACAMVNPNQVGDLFPSKALAGVGVIFYVMLALRAHLKSIGWFDQHCIDYPNMTHFLDLVALGTVADVVPLDRNNRLLVHHGLQRIRAGKACPGIKALLRISGRQPQQLRASDLGFAIGPRLNAAGRLDDMSLGVACLLEQNEVEAEQMAQQLDDLNHERRDIEAQMQQEAFDAIERLNLNQSLPEGLCLYQADWHQGVVGLVASRVKDKVYRPVVAFAKSDDKTLKGSARSLPGLHIRDVFAAMDAKNPGLIEKFGGHAMAAGLSIPLNHYDQFSRVFAETVRERCSEDTLRAELYSDGELTSADFTLNTATLLQEAGPWGQGFPEPLFDGEFDLIEQRLVGERHLKLMLGVPGSDRQIEGIAFGVDLAKWPNHHCRKVRLAYRLDINEYRGCRRLQLLVEQMDMLQ